MADEKHKISKEREDKFTWGKGDVEFLSPEEAKGLSKEEIKKKLDEKKQQKNTL